MAISPHSGQSYHETGEGMSEPVANTNTYLNDILSGGAVLVEDRDLSSPPGGESEGETWLVNGTGSGAWLNHDDEFASYTGSGWVFVTPKGGNRMFIKDEKAEYAYSSVESLWYPIQELLITAEHWTGRYSQGGAKIYAKTLTGIGALADRGQTTTAHSITNLDLDNHIKIEGGYYETTTPALLHDLAGATTWRWLTSTNLVIQTGVNLSTYTCGPVRMEYCKTA